MLFDAFLFFYISVLSNMTITLLVDKILYKRGVRVADLVVCIVLVVYCTANYDVLSYYTYIPTSIILGSMFFKKLHSTTDRQSVEPSFTIPVLTFYILVCAVWGIEYFWLAYIYYTVCISVLALSK